MASLRPSTFALVLVLLSASCSLAHRHHEHHHHSWRKDVDDYPMDPLATYCFDYNNVPIYVPAPESGASLLQIQVHHRHGSHVPLIPWPFQETVEKAPSFTCNNPVYPTASVNNTGKHNVPSPKTSYPGNCTDGQLTQTGYYNMEQIGVSLRTAYAVGGSLRTHNFLPMRLDASKVFVYTSLYDRCIESAVALMEGLYPFFPGDPNVTYHNSTEFGGDLLGAPWSCKNFTDIERRAYSEPDWKRFAHLYAEPAAQVAAQAWNVSDDVAYEMLNETMDILGILKCANVPYPGLDDKQASEVASIRSEFLWGYSTLPWTRGVFAAAWYTQVLKFLTDAANGVSTAPLYVQWSGHDISLMNALGALNITQNSTSPAVNFPNYGSTLVFELWSTSKGPALRMLYNGRVLTWPLEWCGGQDVCTLDNFTAMVQGALAVPGWQQACPMGNIKKENDEKRA